MKKRLVQAVQNEAFIRNFSFGFALGLAMLTLLILACVSPHINLLGKFLHIEDDRQRADVVVVFSSTILKKCHAHPHSFMREGFGAQLFRDGYSRSGKFIISGTYSQPPYSAAKCHAHMAQILRVPPQALILDNNSQTTAENALHVRAIMKKHGWKTALLVTSDSHMRRAMQSLGKQGVHVFSSQIPDYPPFHDEWLGPNRIANLHRLLYEYGALVKYRWYGYI